MRLAETGALIALTALTLAACNKPQVAEADKPPANSEVKYGLQETTVPGMGVTTNVVARTGSMASGTQNSSTVAGAAPPGKTNPADAH